jgi:hypothetical protein
MGIKASELWKIAKNAFGTLAYTFLLIILYVVFQTMTAQLCSESVYRLCIEWVLRRILASKTKDITGE